MALGLRLVSICVVAGFYGAATAAHSETAGLLRPAIAEDEAPAEEPAVIPSLTITPEEEQAPLNVMRPILDPYAAPGLKLGGMALYPELETEAVYTSNVASSAADAKSDVGLSLRPSLRFESDWVRHSWTGRAAGDFTAYLENDDLNSTQIDAASKFRLDIRHTTRAEFDASYALGQESSADSEVPDTATGNRTDHTLAANAAIIHDFGGLEGRAKVGIERQIFEDVDLSGGGTEDNSDRNNYTPSLALRLSYTDPPALKPFVELAYAPRFHDKKIDRNGLHRDSQGLMASVGVTLDRGPFWSGEMALVYAMRDYEDSALATNDAIGINGNLTWSPTELTTVVVALATGLNESSSATSSGTRTWSGRIDIAHELRENVTLLGGLGVEFEKFSGGTDTTLSPNFGVEWQLNPTLAWTAGYDGTWVAAADSGGNYNEQRLMTGFVLRR
ncbi:MAG: outer membrane beta-barrel protein [Aestuariivirga sp.]